jgi:hypothetical protein
MKKRLLAAACAAVLSLNLASCTTVDVRNAFNQAAATIQEWVNTLNTAANYALGQIPALCNDAYNAHAAFLAAKAEIKFNAKIVADENAAASAIAVVCNNPPTTIADALVRFKPAYTAFKNAQAAAAAQASASGQ